MRENFEKLADEFINAIEENPTSSTPFDIIAELESRILRFVWALDEDETIEFGKLSSEEMQNINEILNELGLSDVLSILDYIVKRAKFALQDTEKAGGATVEEYLERLKIPYSKTSQTILEPKHQSPIQVGSGNWEDAPSLTSSKLRLLLETLHDINIYTSDICVVKGTNSSNMMRKGSYLCVEIPKLNRTIFIHNEYAEATFVLPGIFDRHTVFSMTKDELQTKLSAVKIPFSESNPQEWKMRIIESLGMDEESKGLPIDINSYSEKRFYIHELKLLYPDPEVFMSLSFKERQSIKINEKGLSAISTILVGDVSLAQLCRLVYQYALFAEAVYGSGHECIEKVKQRENAIKVNVDESGIAVYENEDELFEAVHLPKYAKYCGFHKKLFISHIAEAEIEPLKYLKGKSGNQIVELYPKELVDTVRPYRIGKKGYCEVLLNGERVEIASLNSYTEHLVIGDKKIKKLVEAACLKPIKDVKVFNKHQIFDIYLKSDIDRILNGYTKDSVIRTDSNGTTFIEVEKEKIEVVDPGLYVSRVFNSSWDMIARWIKRENLKPIDGVFALSKINCEVLLYRKDEIDAVIPESVRNK